MSKAIFKSRESFLWFSQNVFDLVEILGSRVSVNRIDRDDARKLIRKENLKLSYKDGNGEVYEDDRFKKDLTPVIIQKLSVKLSDKSEQ